MNIVCLLGRGRSGTTWIGQMLAAHRDCMYKFEPFLRGKHNDYQRWLDRVCSDAGYGSALPELVEICSRPVHDVDYPPFRRRSGWDRSPLVMRALWQLAKWAPVTQWAYQRYGTIDMSAVRHVLIKDVNFPNERLPSLWNAIRPRIIAVLKNPYASVASAAKFYGGSPHVQAEWVARVREVMRSPGHEQFEHFDHELDRMSFEAFEAVRWRVQCEPLNRFVSSHDRCLAVTYESCCIDPLGSIRELCGFAGWEFVPSIEDEIARSTDGKSGWRERRRGLFLTRRDPIKAMSAWKRQLTAEQIREIDSVVCESPLLPLWDGDSL